MPDLTTEETANLLAAANAINVEWTAHDAQIWPAATRIHHAARDLLLELAAAAEPLEPGLCYCDRIPGWHGAQRLAAAYLGGSTP